MSNEELWHKTSQEPIAVEIKRRKWRWIGHTLRKPDGAIENGSGDLTKILNIILVH
jgi:hypothetical protein